MSEAPPRCSQAPLVSTHSSAIGGVGPLIAPKHILKRRLTRRPIRIIVVDELALMRGEAGRGDGAIGRGVDTERLELPHELKGERAALGRRGDQAILGQDMGAKKRAERAERVFV